jgi:hypothetical protein
MHKERLAYLLTKTRNEDVTLRGSLLSEWLGWGDIVSLGNLEGSFLSLTQCAYFL